MNSSEIIKSTDKKIKIEYDYNNENLQSFVTILSQNLEEPESVSSESFEKFSEIFKLSIDQSCNIAIPKTTKRNFVNNQWMTAGITKSICINDKLYENWISSFKTIDGGDNKLKEKHKNHQKTLRWLIKKLKSQHYPKKFENSQGDKKKTWKIINELRGKQKTNVKASFVIGNERIICRRIIAVSLASNLNYETYNEIPITSFPPFESYMSNSCESSIFMEDCNEQEILGIINDLQNGKASDIPIVTIKVARTVISPYLTTLYNSCFASGIFPKVLKISKITPIHKKGNKELIENYRPVSTLPVFGKIFEKLIYSRVYRFLTYKGILSDAQFGFRKGHSTAHAIHYSADIVKSALGIFIYKDMKWLPLHLRRQLHMSTYMFKIINGNSPPQLRDKFVYITGGSRDGNMCNLYTNKSKTHKQFYYLGAKCWNILPQPLRLAESAKTFSNTLKRRLLHNIEIDERYVVDNSYNYIYKLND